MDMMLHPKKAMILCVHIGMKNFQINIFFRGCLWMDYVNSFSAMKAKRAYMVFVYDFHPDGTAMLFQVDTGASVLSHWQV